MIDGLAAGVSVRARNGDPTRPAVLKTSAVANGRVDITEVKAIVDADVPRAKCELAANSIVISRMNTPALIGAVGWVPNGAPGVFLPDRLWLARPSRNSEVDGRWLAYALGFGDIANSVRGLATGTSNSMKNIPKSRLLDLVIDVPALAEQSAIAQILECVDDLLDALERLLVKKRSLKLAMMQELLTGRRRLPGHTSEWMTLRLAADSHLKARIGWQGLTTEEYRQSGEYRLVGGTDFSDGRVDWDVTPFVDKWRFDQDSNIQLRDGDVLITKDGTIGKVALVDELPSPSTLNSGVFVVRPRRATYDSRFLYCMLRSRAFDEFVTGLSAGSTINHLYQKDLVKLEFRVPSELSEQREIADVLLDADADISALSRRLESARSVKEGMMQELLTGRTRLVAEGVAA